MTNKVNFDDVNKYAKVLGIAAKGKSKEVFINEVLDAIVGQYSNNEENMSTGELEEYKEKNRDMLEFYMNNKDYDLKGPPPEVKADKAEESLKKEPVVEKPADKEPEDEPEKGQEKKAKVGKEEEKKAAVKKAAGKKVEKKEAKAEKKTSRFSIFAQVFRDADDPMSIEELVDACNTRYVEQGGPDNRYQAAKNVQECLKVLAEFGLLNEKGDRYSLKSE